MYYYHVWVRSDQYRASEPLTYASSDTLSRGQIVSVPLRKELVLGIVVQKVPKPGFATKQISHIFALPKLPHELIALAEWLSTYYATPIGTTTSLLLPRGLQPKNTETTAYVESSKAKPSKAEPLTEEQRKALHAINAPDTYLLHGRTGSGKTRLYLELCDQAIARHESALILSPEIGLTSQLARAFRQRFDDRVVILHSQLSPAQRLKAWLRILRAKEPLVVIGPRSALFCPLASIGLIVIDEAHDSAYKQEQPPYYHAVRVGSQLRQLHNAVLVLGSATPAVTDYYMADMRHKPILQLTNLARTNTSLSHEIILVDLKDRTHFSRAAHLSDQLLAAVDGSLERGEQALLFLNRRGTARVILCEVCGWQARCPHCDLPLAYHGDTFRLRCHTCGYNQPPVTSCPVCGNPSVVFKSFGTKAIVEEVQALFPNARIARLDSDSAKAESLEQRYESIIGGNIDILVGTQVLTKGLDLPRLSTLGVILADSSLYLPDYTAQERTYQLLSQVLGRVGRGHVDSKAIVQTYYPENPLLKAAVANDWGTFYAAELAERRAFGFPPFRHLLKLSSKRASPQSAEKAVNAFKEKLVAQGLPIEIDGPAPAFHEKVAGSFRWQLVVKAKDRRRILEVIKLLPPNWSYDPDPADLL